MKIAVCVDGSTHSKKALDEACEFAEFVNGEIVLIHSVQESVQSEGDELIQEGNDEAIEKAESLLQDMEEDVHGEDKSVAVSTEVLYSNNGKVDDVVSYLDEEMIDYVFIGHRALDKREEELFGSFAKDMVSNCNIPVTVVSGN